MVEITMIQCKYKYRTMSEDYRCSREAYVVTVLTLGKVDAAKDLAESAKNGLKGIVLLFTF